MSGTESLNIGVIGLGRRRYLLENAHRPDEGLHVIAAADPRDVNWKTFAAKINPDISFSRDYHELLARKDLDVVFILSCDYLHEEHAVAALEAGKHIYLEKPMAITTEGCDRILECSMATGAKVYVGHNMRHNDVFLTMKERIDKGAIGEVRTGWCRHFVSYGGDAYFKDWHAERDKATSLLLQKASHDIDTLHWLCSGATRRVTAMGNLTVYNQVEDRHSPEEYGNADWDFENWPPLSQTGINPVVDVEDLSMMLMQLDNGVLCSYEQCHYSPDAFRNFTIIGTEGRIENCGDVPGESTIRVWNKRVHYQPEGHINIEIPPAEGGHGGADPKIVNEFISWVRDSGKISTTAVEARNSVAAGCAATFSLRNGNIPVEIPPVDKTTTGYFSRERK